MEQVLQLVVVFFAALATGGLMVNWLGLGRTMSRLSTSTYVEFHQATNHTFDPYMPIVVVGALLGVGRMGSDRIQPPTAPGRRQNHHRIAELLREIAQHKLMFIAVAMVRQWFS